MTTSTTGTSTTISNSGTTETDTSSALATKVSRRGFLGVMLAAPTLTLAAKMPRAGAGPLGDGLFGEGLLDPEDLLDIGLPDPSDIIDLGDLLILAEAPYRYDLVLEVTTDNRVRFELPRLEKGQGIATAVAMILADEIGARLADTDVDLSDARLDRPFTITGSSHNVRAFWDPVRVLAASARARLITVAASRLGVSADQLVAQDTAVVAPDGRSVSFGELSEAASGVQVPAVDPSPKAPEDYQIIGTGQGRVDAHDIVTGQASYALDLPVPDALPTVVARPPDIGGTVASYDATAAQGMPGVAAIAQIPTGIAVVARTYHEAFQARDALEVSWNRGPAAGMSSDTVSDTLHNLPYVPLTPGALLTTVVDATFEFPYMGHAPLEVQTAVADVRAESAEIWFASQSPVVALQAVAAAVGLPQSKVTLHVPRAGGAFGRRLFFEAPIEAAQISQAVGRPVKLMWTRNDDTRHGRFRPASLHRVRAQVAAGSVLSYDHRMSAAETDFRHGFGELLTATGSDLAPGAISQTVFQTTVSVPYDFGVATQLLSEVQLPVPTGSWRSIFSGGVATSNEIMVDRIAATLRRDPVAFRRAKLSDDRSKAVLDTVTREGGWGRSLPAGVAQGVAVHVEYRSAVAYLVELDTRGAEPRVTKVTVAVDVGRAINPTGLEAQLQGVTCDAITTMLRAGNHLDDGRIREGSYGDFLWARMNHSPFSIDVHIMEPTGDPGGAGELGYPAAAAAIVNAYTRATGELPTRFPLNKEF